MVKNDSEAKLIELLEEAKKMLGDDPNYYYVAACIHEYAIDNNYIELKSMIENKTLEKQ